MFHWWGLEYALLVGIRICFIGGDLNILYRWVLEYALLVGIRIYFIGGDWSMLYW